MPERESGVQAAVTRAIDEIRRRQEGDGKWNHPLESDASFTADHVLLMHYVNRVEPDLERGMVRYIRGEQLESGGWAAFPGGPPVLDVSVLCYAAMKASGVPASDPELVRAREAIGRMGGLTACSTLVRPALALLGQIPMRVIPYMNIHLVSAPRWIHPNIYDLSVYALVAAPMALLVRRRAVRPLPEGRGIEELLRPAERWKLRPEDVPGRADAARAGRRAGGMAARMKTRLTWASLGAASGLSKALDWVLPAGESERKALDWIADRQGPDGSIGETFWTTMLGLMALDTSPDARFQRAVDRGMAGLKDWLTRDGRGMWQQFMRAATCHTAICLRTLVKAGAAADGRAVTSAADWLASRQSRVAGDWSRHLKGEVEAGGWSFGDANPHYPDTDDTAIALLGLGEAPLLHRESFSRGVEWLLAMEHRDGGWAPYTRVYRERFFCSTEAIVPGTSDLPDDDITARVLTVLAPLRGSELDGGGRIARTVGRGLRFLWKRRREDGAWCGRWVTNYVYGTSQVLEALACCGEFEEDARAEASLRWLLSVQNADGGWGESRRGYETGRFEPGPSSPLVTSAALQALTAVGCDRAEALRKGTDYLLATQKVDGLWRDDLRSGVIFPGISYTSYELVASCGAVIALCGVTREMG